MSSDGSPFLRVDVGRLTTAAIVIGGVVIGVSGLYVFFSRQQQRQLAHLTRTIEGLRKDVGELKLVAGSNVTNDCNFSSAKKSGQPLHRTPQAFNQHKVHADTSRTASIADENGSELYFDVSDDDNYNTDFANSTTRDIDVGLSEANDECRSSAAVTSTIDFEAIDLLLAGNDVDNELAYSKLASNKALGMADPEFVWRLVRACYLCFLNAGRLGDAQRQKGLIAEGMEYSIAGLAIDNDHPDLHKWYAVLLGRSTDFLGIQDKIKNGFKFKEHLDQAIRLRPDDRTLYFMKGRWCYEVAMLSWVERKVAATLFATPPTSTLDEARQQFLKVEELFPLKWKENLLYIAKCLIGEGNYAEAMKWLNKSANVDCQTPDEEIIEVEVKQLLSKYRKYDA